ncbi:TIR domain-containing protein [Rhodococcus sp. MSC1_016]|jgi:hypothetical protein|uniref:TIR domain-containing protein n=1 Tax=Rhodococcus sp. MSC1_016 TaxID=2909266 RepID=UPI002030C39A|nr:TIR domain-containing protein [Rhodococcus sp. MSC1_016]
MTTSEEPAGFWSYVHADNDAEHGRILRLCQLIEAEYSLITGNEIHMFVDRTDIGWGDKWRKTIDDALAATTFFIPIVTARYLQRTECRRELIQFSKHAERRGVKELLLPILYSAVSDLEENSEDEVEAIIASTQYENWTALRLEEEHSAKYRTSINKLALRLAEIAETIAERPEIIDVGSEIDLLDDEDADNAPGILDSMAEVEELFPVWTKTIETLTSEINEIGDIFTEYAPQMQSAGQAGRSAGASAKLAVARRLAGELNPIADRIISTGSQYADQTLRMDGAISGILLSVANDSTYDRDGFKTFATGIRQLRDAGEKAIHALDGVHESAQNVGSMSRDLRKPLGKIARAIQRFTDGQGLFDEWVRRIDEIEG